MVKTNRERVHLRRRKKDVTLPPKKPIDVIVSGYGDSMGDMLIGRFVGSNTRTILIQFKDSDGVYIEHYQRQSGIRVGDLRDRESGWKIDQATLKRIFLHEHGSVIPEEKPIVPDEPAEFVLISREEIPYLGDPSDKMVTEVWREKTEGTDYFKAYRTGPVGDGGLKSPKELTCVVTFDRLRQVLFDFESNQKGRPKQEKVDGQKKTR